MYVYTLYIIHNLCTHNNYTHKHVSLLCTFFLNTEDAYEDSTLHTQFSGWSCEVVDTAPIRSLCSVGGQDLNIVGGVISQTRQFN